MPCFVSGLDNALLKGKFFVSGLDNAFVSGLDEG